MPDKEGIARLLAKAGPRSRAGVDKKQTAALVTRLKGAGRLRDLRSRDLASAHERRQLIVERARRIDPTRKRSTGD